MYYCPYFMVCYLPKYTRSRIYLLILRCHCCTTSNYLLTSNEKKNNLNHKMCITYSIIIVNTLNTLTSFIEG